MPVVYFFTKSAKSRTLLAAKILFYSIVLLTGGRSFFQRALFLSKASLFLYISVSAQMPIKPDMTGIFR